MDVSAKVAIQLNKLVMLALVQSMEIGQCGRHGVAVMSPVELEFRGGIALAPIPAHLTMEHPVLVKRVAVRPVTPPSSVLQSLVNGQTGKLVQPPVAMVNTSL